jgi:hypothetical protein
MEKLNVNEVELNGVVFIRKDSVVNKQFEGDIKIVVLQRGWVYIGRFERNGNDCKLHNAYNVRTWGTTKGLPELVNGATNSTKLDKCEGIVEFDWLTTVYTITVNKKAWNL